ncbi:DNA-binding transcriptional LysR family regulator [Lachnospiraceae bacterium PM6-15]|uniref:LysR family transcriptional regulator n=1 Tax=Ohessyouella blattaphilus TaxID=2949333 RepID=UPI003E1BF19A
MFEEMRAFVAVAEVGSYTKAAEIMSFSQPTISQQVRRLEMFFGGVSLFEKSGVGNSIRLTEAGEYAFASCKDMLSLLDETIEVLNNKEREEVTRVRIGASHTICNFLVPKLLKLVEEELPGLEIITTIGNTKKICSLLDKGTIDLGLIEGRDMYFPFVRQNFYEDEMILIGSPYLATLISDLKPATLSRQAWIVREQGSGTRQEQMDFMRTMRLSAHQIRMCHTNGENIEMVANDLGLSLVSRLSAENSLALGKVVEIPLKKRFVRNFSYIYREGSSLWESEQLSRLFALLESF